MASLYFERIKRHIKERYRLEGTDAPTDKTLEGNYKNGWQNVCEAAVLVAYEKVGFDGIAEMMSRMGLGKGETLQEKVRHIRKRYDHNLRDMVSVARARAKAH